ncbi:MAG: CBS domain-containing protein [Burkholderiales bacterium]|nr:CBS domain-containing protein [Burkholderiales bacterium]
MQVKEILRIKGSTLYTVTPTTTLADAVISMADHDIGSVVVMEGGKLAGMLTFREIIKVLAKRQQENRVGPTPTMSQISVAEVMNAQPAIASPAMEVDELRSVMIESHQRYMPVMEADTLLGVISFHDVARAVLEEQAFENRMLKGYIKNWPA